VCGGICRRSKDRARKGSQIKIYNVTAVKRGQWETDQNQMQIVQMKLLWFVAIKCHLDKNRSADIREEPAILNLNNNVQQYTHQLLLRTERMDQHRLPRQTWGYRPRGRWWNGRPRKRWRRIHCLITQHSVKTYLGNGGITPRILTSALDTGKWSASRPGRFTPGGRAPSIHWIGWAPESFWPQWRREKSHRWLRRKLNPGRPVWILSYTGSHSSIIFDSYLRYPWLKSRPGCRLFWQHSWFSPVCPGGCCDSYFLPRSVSIIILSSRSTQYYFCRWNDVVK
jgi:hypothetical protein